MSQSVAGGFADKVVGKVVVSDTFVPAKIRDIKYVENVRYYSSMTRMYHRGKASVVDRQEDDRVKSVHPDLCLDIRISEIGESVLVDVDPSDIVQFGSVDSLNGSFSLDEDSSEIQVKISSDSVTIEDVGSFDRVDDEGGHVSTYGNADSYDFWNVDSFSKVIRDRLRKAWFKSYGGYEGVWRVDEVQDPEYSSSARIKVVHPDFKNPLWFMVSMNEWDDNPSLRKFIKKDAMGVPSNLEESFVFVSLSDYSHIEPVAVDRDWKLYRKNDKPNVIRRFVDRLF
jgi:hypothetical protein